MNRTATTQEARPMTVPFLTTDDRLLDLLPTEQLANRLRIMRNGRYPLRYRTPLVQLLAQRAA